MTAELLICNARIVSDGAIRDGDVLVAEGRIAAIGGDLSARPVREVCDAGGRLLLPGLIDDQVHFREPGLTHKAEIATESRAAVAGGVTTVFEMPNTKPETLDAERLEAKYARAAQVSAANYAFYLGASNTNLDAVRNIDPRSCAGIKVFMGSSTGDMLVDREEVLDGIFRDAPCIIATHCEHSPTISAAEAAARARWGEAVPAAEHARIRSREACLASSSFAVELARRHGARLHVLHLSTAEELALFADGPLASKRITGEACIHHLWFCDLDYERLGHRLKCNPAIKKPTDRAALRAALRSGRLDCLATDHAPHSAAEKAGSYFQAPAGLPLVQHLLPTALELVAQGELSYERLVEAACHAPAEIFHIRERGHIREGWQADLVLVDPQRPWTVEPGQLYSKCAWSPFEGQRYSHHIDRVWVNGRLAAVDGVPLDGVLGQRVAFDR